MDLVQLKATLAAAGDKSLLVRLPGGKTIPEHFHVTEIGRVRRDFIDCGGTVRRRVTCLLQAWVAHDVDHRLSASKLLKILETAASAIMMGDCEYVEIEYGVATAAQYRLAGATSNGATLVLELADRATECLAPDKCGVTAPVAKSPRRVSKCCSGKKCC
jgi:Family of unknown function (DUF6428)